MTTSTNRSKEPGDESHDALRCGCGALVARRVPGGVELKCRRCRRILLLTLGADGSVTVSGDPS